MSSNVALKESFLILEIDMNQQKKSLYPQTQDTLFTQLEHSILATYLGTHTPRGVVKIDPLDFIDCEDTVGIAPKSNYSGEAGKYLIPNAVARIVLHAIQPRLPNFRYITDDGPVVCRDHRWERKSKLHLSPRHLLKINWAFSGPGIPWYEQYHLCYIPLYCLYIVTLSHDSPDVFGYNDIVIGHFVHNIQKTEIEAGRIIRNWWWDHSRQGGQRFEQIIKEGLISADEANFWADEIWEEEKDDDDQDWTPIELEMAESSGLPLEEIREWLECH